ncbi:cadherin-like beta sandwich domain-containing protein, partial [uncultured Mucilaginibacter sp.]|uniref:cadherin-like beta sandwich domain-containing protein n=1 Tax=uncultured Mucilaginibacter sp. TaxID=797541 RepID=UPI0025CBEC9E
MYTKIILKQTTFSFIIFILLILAYASGIAQAPNISYSTPQVYTAGIAISQLAPVNIGGPVPLPNPVIISAGLNNITGITSDAAGNIYVAENGNNAVRKIPAGGGTAVTIGSGFVYPTGVAVDASGNVYVVDYGNNAVKEILASNGSIITLETGFNGPYGIALDASKNIYVADASNNEIKEFLVGTTTPIILGSGFNHPTGVAVDASGNVYVADRGNNLIKKIPAGNGPPVTLGGGSGNPNGLSVDAAHNVYFADTNLPYITEITAAGGSNIIVGSGFYLPTCVNIDATGNIYVGDNGNGDVKKISFGLFTIKPALPAGLSFDNTTGIISGTPTAVSPATNYSVTASNSSGKSTAVVKITVVLPPKPIINYTSPLVYTAGATISPISPVNTGGPEYTANGYSISPALPSGLLFDVNTGIISGTPVAGSPSTNYTVTAANAGGNGTAIVNIMVNLPAKPIISYTTPQVYTTLTPISTLWPVSTGGAVFPSGGYSVSPALPAGLSFDLNTGAISGTPGAVAAAANYTVTASNYGGSSTATINITVKPYPVPVISYKGPQVFDVSVGITPLAPTSSGVGTTIGSSTTTIGSGFYNLTSVAVDGAGNVYVAENGNNAIREIPAGGGGVITIGSGFITPTGVAVDAAGNVYVADYGNNAVKKVPVGGGAIVNLGSGYNGPYGVAVDAADNIYIGDANNNAVKKIPAGSNVPVNIGSGFNHPTGIAVDAAGNVYVADRANNQIKKILASNGATIALSYGFGNPNGVAVDGSGNVYFADTNSSSIEEIPAAGGSLINVGSGFVTPSAVTIDGGNVVYIADNGNGAVKKISFTGGYYISPQLPSGLVFNTTTGVISGTPTAPSPATVYTVTAYNIGGSAKATLSIKVVNPSGGLANLAVSAGTLSPVFATATNVYRVSVTNAYSSITFTPTTADAGDIVTVNGTTVNSGTPSLAIPLAAGPNTVNIVVKNSGGTVLGIYTITVTRALSSNAYLAQLSLSAGLLSPAFNTSIKVYTASVPYISGSLILTPSTTDPTATVTVNGTPVLSGSPSQAIPLNVGSNAITVTVTAQNGVTARTYTLTANRAAPSTNASLANLTTSAGILSPVFAAATLNYTANVPNSPNFISITPTVADVNATVFVNGLAVSSGAASAAIPLAVGTNTISTVVIAQDGTTTETYTLTINRAGSPNANLAGLAVNNGTLKPVFSSATTSYTVKVANGITSITVTPTKSDTTATLAINGIGVASGMASGPIVLNVGANTITTLVTAGDGVTTKTYTLIVTRLPSSNAHLSALHLSGVTLTPTFSATTVSYTSTVANSITSTTVTPTTAQANATVTVNGTQVTSGTASQPIALSTGSNVITTTVTAQDGITTTSYTVTITRSLTSVNEPASTALISGLPQISEDGILVHQGISPNGDGLNDFLVIEGIARYPDNKLMIMSRSGELDYEIKGYDNSNKVFDGHSNK